MQVTFELTRDEVEKILGDHVRRHVVPKMIADAPDEYALAHHLRPGVDITKLDGDATAYVVTYAVQLGGPA